MCVEVTEQVVIDAVEAQDAAEKPVETDAMEAHDITREPFEC